MAFLDSTKSRWLIIVASGAVVAILTWYGPSTWDSRFDSENHRSYGHGVSGFQTESSSENTKFTTAATASSGPTHPTRENTKPGSESPSSSKSRSPVLTNSSKIRKSFAPNSSRKPENPRSVASKSVPLQNFEQRRESLVKKLLHRDPKGNLWNINFNESGMVKSISGGVLPEVGKSVDSIHTFVLDIAEEMGVPSEQVNSSPQQQTNALNIIYDVFQKVQGYEVEDGFIRAQATPEGGVYYIASELKQVENPLVEKNSDITDLQEVIRAAYPNRTFIIENKNQIPLRIYVTEAGSSELSWICMVRFQQVPKDRRKMIIGAKTLKIYIDESQHRF